ncbi:Cobaltochelatase [Arthrobacter crystallopoietes BAB-32]|uniref:Cobaltochelatase n=1 Tax=Arthrobacter crystallopoietes BAB-32 TaxID=1246476 RepID=N1V2L6_9MICC|nr:hypothetical protein [Arthrobacter crystallopoietes]EMY34239.1 Cobaltochelatase [Arthrobacter crystallopoietes BAB-32]
MSATDTAAQRRRQRIEQLGSAAVRALSGDPAVELRGRNLYRGGRLVPLEAPHLYPEPAARFPSFRGATDGMALRLRHSDPDLHRRLLPEPATARLVFETLEQLRVEALAAAGPGMVRNLRARHEEWSLAFHRSGLTETSVGLLLYTALQVCRSRVTAQPVVAETEDLIEETRGRLTGLLGPDLALLRRRRFHQEAYAVPALSIASALQDAVDAADEQAGAADASRDRKLRAEFSLLVDLGDDGGASVSGSADLAPGSGAGGYRAFTTAYDRVLQAGSLVRREQLLDFRRWIDDRVRESGVNVARLARRLEPLLSVPESAGWDFGQEEGVIDGGRLSQLVSSPGERRLFKTVHTGRQPATAVSFLLDCSGSMKHHAEDLAVFLDLFLRAFDQAGISSEVLGFTTGAWNGGRALREWQRAGKPEHPGRLNETCHLVFKDADTSWRRARPSIAALLKTTLFREGVDGEAVQWAARRLAERPEQRRILFVVSDGSPADGATALANDEQYLDRHLAAVTAGLDAQGLVSVYGLGLGLDLSRYYRRSLILDTARLGEAEGLREVLTLLERTLPPLHS